MSERSGRYIQIGVSFLTTCTKKPDEDNFREMKWELKYLKGTRHMEITLIVDSMSILRWLVVVPYNTHEDYKGRTRYMMFLWKGSGSEFLKQTKIL